jgi:hypothetical protein
MVDQLAAFLGDGTEGTFRVEDATLGVRTAEVYLAAGGADVTWTGGLDVDYTLYLLAPDPRKYGTALTVGPTGISVPAGGLTFPLFGSPANGVLNLGGGGYVGQVTARNTGYADTGPIFVVTADAAPNGFSITETTSSDRLVYDGPVYQGQVITLDSNDGSVTMSPDVPKETELIVAEWSRLARGESGTWLFEAPGSTNAAMTVKVVPAWW